MEFLSKLGDAVVAASNWLWGPPLLLLLGFGGLFLTIRFGFIQFRHIGYIFSQTFGKMFQKSEDGISPFRLVQLPLRPALARRTSPVFL